MAGLTLDGNAGSVYEFHGDNLSGFESMEIIYEEDGEPVVEISLPFTFSNGTLSATMGAFTGGNAPYRIEMTSQIGSFRIPVVFQFP